MFPTEGLEEVLGFVSLFFLSILAELLHCAPAATKIEVLHICSRGLQTARAGT